MKCNVSNICSLKRCKITQFCLFDNSIVIHGYCAPDDQFKAEPAKVKKPLVLEYMKFQFKTTEKECFYCGVLLGKKTKTKDHVFPRSKGGTLPNNFVWACGKCNAHKGHKTIEEWMELLLNDELMKKQKPHLRGHRFKIMDKLKFMIEKLKAE